MRSALFAKRNMKEIVRDPLSWVFCLAFPVLLLLLFVMINHYTPETYWFRLDYLAPGICVFSFAFVMLYTAMLVSKDRATSFLTRLYTTPMRTTDFLCGYMATGLGLSIAEGFITFVTACVIGLFMGQTLAIGRLLLCLVVFLPVMALFVSLGMLFGTLFSDKAAPGVSSAIISASAILGGAWMPLETMGKFETVCQVLPFYPATTLGRYVLMGTCPSVGDFLWRLGVVCAWTVVIFFLAMVAFKKKMSGED